MVSDYVHAELPWLCRHLRNDGQTELEIPSTLGCGRAFEAPANLSKKSWPSWPSSVFHRLFVEMKLANLTNFIWSRRVIETATIDHPKNRFNTGHGGRQRIRTRENRKHLARIPAFDVFSVTSSPLC